ncbi:TPA: glycosyltransferase family 4 protein [Vibrio parahaemolyticus]|uniref:glycosyltransferase family 4 protein n=1 Tax=Vibrio parahaemolyticus TaxID=670 RepID=UPI00084BA4CD|nr:glycosyltransferase family 4 protein [Vibrio parahaemolyticus]EID7760870.1 glycosyltransferase [Vibrio parahaemolyticus]ODW12325.1 glycosyl transferase family 1 [Vibrio parahaemolyticus]ODW19223.1 glycosyl transferase family 1 [Vibrio parahaemolyticus]HCG6518410.1 glycosyltransferase [Vibrio parahaemolyticus]HCH0196980.1 glycosyltransferase [Vibrio parahaemolyticus]
MESICKKSILVLTPRFPYPVIGGDRLRVYELCRELSKTYSLTLVSLCETPEEMSYHIPDDGVFTDVQRVYLSKWKSYFNCLIALPTQKPFQVAYYNSNKFEQLVKQLAPSHDLILPHLIRMADYAKDLPNKKILEMTDAISMNYLRFIDNKNSTGLKGLIYQLEYKRLNRYEKEVAKNFDYNVLVSKFDKEFLFPEDSFEYKKTLVCSNGVDLSKLPYAFKAENKELVFIGNMFSAQNFDAAYWFASEVVPLLQRYGDYKFKVIGRIKEDAKNKLLKFDNVIVTGAVDNVVAHAHGALAGICSVRLAAGVQNKILEYMALGLPTITSTTGLEGLDAIPNKDLLVADYPEQYVEQIIKLSNDVDYSKTLAESALQYVTEHHSWSGKLKPLLISIEQLL